MYRSLLRSIGLLALAGTGSYGLAQTPPSVEATTHFGGLTNPIGLTNAGDGSGRLFVVQQGGRIRVWDGVQLLTAPFLDIEHLTNGVGESGLLGLAFHPQYSVNGYFFINYTDQNGHTVIARYQASPPNTNVADPASALRILGFVQPFANHNGGDMHFGPDGYLYVASGDGGDQTTAQDSASLLGKILRIDVDGDDFPSDPERNYRIPPDNPLVGVAGAAPEIYLLGLRNPWRFSIDRPSGDLFIGDVGEAAREEVNHLPAASAAGANLGWPCWEGSLPLDSDACDPKADYVFPIFELAHGAAPNNNCSVIGGFRYRGPYTSMRDWYFYSDWCTGQLWAGIETPGVGNGWVSHLVGQMNTFTTTGYGLGEDGHLYAAAAWMGVLRIGDPDGDDTIFANGFE